MKKIIVAVLAVIMVVSALCVVSSASSEYGEDEFIDSGIVLHVGDVFLVYGNSCYNKEFYERYKDYDPDDGDPFELKEPVPEAYYDLPGYDVLTADNVFCAVDSDLISVVEVIAGDCYVVTCRAPGTFSLYSYSDEFITYYTAVIEDTGSGSFIASFLSGLTEIFSGLVKGLAGVSVSAADSLILDSKGNLTSFSQLGIIFIGFELVLAVVFFLVRRMRMR